MEKGKTEAEGLEAGERKETEKVEEAKSHVLGTQNKNLEIEQEQKIEQITKAQDETDEFVVSERQEVEKIDEPSCLANRAVENLFCFLFVSVLISIMVSWSIIYTLSISTYTNIC